MFPASRCRCRLHYNIMSVHEVKHWGEVTNAECVNKSRVVLYIAQNSVVLA